MKQCIGIPLRHGGLQRQAYVATVLVFLLSALLPGCARQHNAIEDAADNTVQEPASQSSPGRGSDSSSDAIEQSPTRPIAKWREDNAEVISSAEQLLVDMQPSAYPDGMPGKEASLKAAAEWCESHLKGKAITWSETLERPTMSATRPYTLEWGARPIENMVGREVLMFGQPKMIPAAPGSAYTPQQLYVFIEVPGRTVGVLKFEGCTLEEARQLRQATGDVTFHSRIESIVGVYGEPYEVHYPNGQRWQRFRTSLIVRVQPPYVNGLRPTGLGE